MLEQSKVSYILKSVFNLSMNDSEKQVELEENKKKNK